MGTKRVELPSRVTHGPRRRLIRLPAFRTVADACPLPRPLTPEAAELVNALEEEGAFGTSIDSLGLKGVPHLLFLLNNLKDELAGEDPEGESSLQMPLPCLYEDPRLFLFGLQERLLDIAENHLRLPVRYHGAELRRELPSPDAYEENQWKLDAYDQRMLKVILYLDDVGPEDGPFEYVPRALSHAACETLRFRRGFLSDEVLATVLPNLEWRTAMGPAATAIFADTARVLHRIPAPVHRERYILTFLYTSRNPTKTPAGEAPLMLPQWVKGLTHRQVASLPPRWL